MSFILKNSLQMSLKEYSKRQCNGESGSTIPELKASVPFFFSLSLYRHFCQLGCIFIKSGVYIWEAIV